MNAQHEGRNYTLTAEQVGANLAADMIARGFEAAVFYGVSQPVGRQRKTFSAMFYKSAKDGHFVFIM